MQISLPVLLPLHHECASWYAAPLVLGLSGGRDSVALLRRLLLEGASLHACHIHHGIRGAAADADEAFCASLCAELRVPYTSYRVDVPLLAGKCGESLETVARRERRRLLAEHARRCGCAAVALAHHADDQAETVLFHLARGAAGLRAMLAVSYADGLTWLRPLLECRREQITAWLRELQQPWCDDATNAVPDVTRNALRLEVLPALAKAMGRDIVPILNRSARLQTEQASALQEALASLPILDPQGRLYLPFLVGKSLAFRKAVVHDFLHRAGVPDISEKVVLSVCSLLAPGASAVCNLPGNYRARRRQKRLFIEPPACAEIEKEEC